MKIAIVPGSFDPMTKGHLDIVKRAAETFDKVVVAVMINSEKKYLFSMEQRLKIAELTCADLEGVSVIADCGMLYELAKKLSASAIVKGVRNDTDREYEEKMAKYNAEKYPDAKTVLLECDPALSGVSSSAVREALEKNEDISGMVSQNALDYILQNSQKA